MSNTKEQQSLHLKDPMSTKHRLKKGMNIKAYYGEISEYQKKAAHKCYSGKCYKGLVIKMALKQQQKLQDNKVNAFKFLKKMLSSY